VARRHGDTTTLVKIFEQGSLLEAQQEAELAATLAQPGVVTYTGVGQDPSTNKPCVHMEYFEGSNLERSIATTGPLTSKQSAQLILQITRVLANFHDARGSHATNGVVHRDIKPANIFLACDSESESRPVLIDLEHAIGLELTGQASPTATGFTGGTHGYSAPEAYDGAHPTPAFDIFGLGATFFYLLTGCTAYPQTNVAQTAEQVRRGCSRLSLLRGQPPVIQNLITNCLAVDPHNRPDCANILAVLAEFLANYNEQAATLDSALQSIQAGDSSSAAAHLEQASNPTSSNAPRHQQLTRLASFRNRLLSRIGTPPTSDLEVLINDNELLELAKRITEGLPRVETFLHRYPLHPGCLDQRRALLAAGHHLLESVLPVVATQKATAHFPAALTLLEHTTLAAKQLGSVSGGLSLPTTDPGHLPGPLLRNPEQVLKLAIQDVSNTGTMHERLLKRLEAAEANIDLAKVGSVIDEITAIYSGASEIAAQMRDRLHRLDFYVQRIATPNRILEQLSDLLDLSNQSHRLDKVQDFVQLCSDRTFRDPVNARFKGGMRGLLDTMEQLLEEFPHTGVSSADPAAALREAMFIITGQAWEHLENATHKLQATPVPIRPVQNLLNRIDGIRMLETFLDLPERSREQLQDEIERVRLRLDQARTARDNIARGAQEAMERGHLTTALYDMERAVENFEGEVDDDPADPKLVEQLEEAKRRKRELEADIGENHRLAARYAQLLEDDQSEPGYRIAALEERAQVLEHLIEILGSDRGAHYQTDLRDVIWNLIQEQSDQGQQELDQTTTASQRASIAETTLTQLRTTLSASMIGNELRGRTKRLEAQWLAKYADAKELRTEDQPQVEVSPQTKLLTTQWRVMVPLGILVIALSSYAYKTFSKPPLSTPPTIGKLSKERVRLELGTDGKLTFAGEAACTELAQFAANHLVADTFKTHVELRGPRIPAHARNLTICLTAWDPNPNAETLKSWMVRFSKELTAFDKALEVLHQRIKGRAEWVVLYHKIVDFGLYAHIAGLSRLAAETRNSSDFERALKSIPSLQHIAIEAELAQIRRLLAKKR
jgi:serine/threonine protein kinase